MANAKKSSSKRSRSAKKMTPAVRHLRYELTNSANPNTETSHYVDLFRDLSRVNRRLYRQGRVAYIKRITITSSNTIANGDDPTSPSKVNAGRVSVSVIPNSWVARSAWKRGFESWMHQQKEAALLADGNIMGTWNDFKVYLSNEARSGNVLDPKDNGANNYAAGEWAYSKLVSPDGTTSADPFFMHMLGDHSGVAGAWNSISLIKSYGDSRVTVNNSNPSVPNELSDDPIVNVIDDGTVVDEVLQYIEGEGDSPPYSHANYPGQDGNGPKPMVVQDVAIANGHVTMGGFEAVCGLLELESRSPIASDVYSVLVELAIGDYRGIKADVI